MSETNSQTGRPQRVLVIGLGTMGMSHARAYQAIDGFDLVGLCTHNASGRADLDKAFPGVPRFEGLAQALHTLKPDAVSINAYTEHHAPMALEAQHDHAGGRQARAATARRRESFASTKTPLLRGRASLLSTLRGALQRVAQLPRASTDPPTR